MKAKDIIKLLKKLDPETVVFITAVGLVIKSDSGELVSVPIEHVTITPEKIINPMS